MCLLIGLEEERFTLVSFACSSCLRFCVQRGDRARRRNGKTWRTFICGTSHTRRRSGLRTTSLTFGGHRRGQRSGRGTRRHEYVSRKGHAWVVPARREREGKKVINRPFSKWLLPNCEGLWRAARRESPWRLRWSTERQGNGAEARPEVTFLTTETVPALLGLGDVARSAQDLDQPR